MKLLIIIQSLVLLLFANSLQNNRAQTIILVDKPKSELYVINKTLNDTIFTCPVGLGKNYGNKVKSGDNRTPEGTFRIVSIEKASHWTHDFHDGHGPRNGAYGDWFIRLSVPGFKGIGIHGTCFPESIGTRSSEGCIRLRNQDLNKLKPLCFVGMKVVILPDPSGNTIGG